MWEQIAANKRKSIMLVFCAALLLAVLGYVLGEYFGGQGYGPGGVVLALIVWLVMTLVAYFQGDQVMLAVAGAKKVSKEELPILHNVVEEMTLAAGLGKVPAVYVIDDPAPNAFTTGRREENAAVAVTSGLMKRLNRDELQGVIAHEIAHFNSVHALGYRAHLAQPVWKSEGWAEYQANVAAIRIEHERFIELQAQEQRRTVDLEQAAEIGAFREPGSVDDGAGAHE